MENLNKNNFKKRFGSDKKVVVFSFIGLFLISVGISLIVFYYISPKGAASLLFSLSKNKASLPKTEECPINGQMYTRVESEIWNTRRPLVAIIENHTEARPEFGLSYADVIYEGVAEGGITRFVSVFYCGVAGQEILAAPIRSARVYFINMAAGYGKNPIFLHQGEANNICSTCPGGVKPSSQISPLVNALTLFDKLDWAAGTRGNNFDAGYNIDFPEIITDQNRLGADVTLAQEHSRVAYLDLVYDAAESRGWTYKDSDGVPWTEGFIKWKFQDGSSNSSPEASSIKFDFWESMPGYDVEWKYDPSTNSYARFNGGEKFIDYVNNNTQIYAKNIAIMFVEEEGPVDTEKHMYYEVLGTGKAIVFQNGQAIKGTWEKESALDREVFYDTNGDEIKMVRGQTWVELVPSTNQVAY